MITAAAVALVLSDAELRALTGFARPAQQLAELHRRGFHRARRVRDGSIVLERAHYDAVAAGRVAANEPSIRP